MKIREVNITLDHLKISALESGHDDGYPTIAVHGWLDNANSFLPMLKYLDPRFKVIALDLPGHGHSEHYTTPNYFHYIDYFADLIKLANKLDFKKFNLIGHSLGAGLCSVLAGTFPEKINKMALIDGLGPIPFNLEDSPKMLRRATEQVISKYSRAPTYKSVEDATLARAKSKLSPLPLELASLLVQRSIIKITDGYKWSNDQRLVYINAMNITEEQVKIFLKKITAKTMLFLPDNGYDFGKATMQDRINAISDITLVGLSGSHHVHMEKPKEISDAINNFFED